MRVAPDHADDHAVLVPSLTLVGRDDLDPFDALGLERVLEELDLLAVERDGRQLRGSDTAAQQSLSDLTDVER